MIVEEKWNKLKLASILRWVKLLFITGGAQAIVQGSGLISGIVIIRLLSVQEYAFYTIANTMLSTMAILADGGISTGVLSQGGKVWQNKEKLGIVLATGLELRRKFAVISLIVSIPILLYILIFHGANWLMATAISTAICFSFIVSLSDSILEIAPKLQQNITLLQKNQMKVSIGRLFLNSVLLLIYPLTLFAILSNGIPRYYGNIQLKKITNNFIGKIHNTSIEVRREILKVVKRNLPGAIYGCFSSQITIWLISFFGNTTSLANIGALGRLSMILSVYTSIFSVLIIPRFARLDERNNIFVKYIMCIIAGSIIPLLLIVSIAIFPEWYLLILGNKYLGLEKELLLSIIIASISFISGLNFNLLASRGFVILPIIPFLTNIITVSVGCIYIDITTLNGVLIFNLLISIIDLGVNSIYSISKLRKIT